MSTEPTLQCLLRKRARTESPGRLLMYPAGNIGSRPIEVTYTDMYEQANRLSLVISSLEGFTVGFPMLLHFDNHWDTILWFWAVLLAEGLPVLSSPFSNVENDRHAHIRNLSALLNSPIGLTSSELLPLFGNDHNIRLHSVEPLLQGPKGDLERQRGVKPAIGRCDCSENGHRRRKNSHDGDVAISNDTQNGSMVRYGSSRNGTTDDQAGSLSMLMLTSGSTGNAKAAQFTHRQVLAAVAGKSLLRKLPGDRSFLNWIGLDHVAGLIEVHLQALSLGMDQVHVSATDIVPSPKTFLDLLSRHRVSHTFAPNFFLAKLVSSIGPLETADGVWDLSSLISIISGGEANDTRTCLAASALFEKYGARSGVIITGFGMTETCAGCIYNVNCPEYDVTRGYAYASVGKCISGTQMRVTESGELQVRGASVFSGYYNNQMATEQAFTADNWFRTGDQGFIDSNGNLRLTGRTKDIVNINGVKMATSDIQANIEKAVGDRVARIVVFSSKAAYTEQVTVAYVPNAFPTPDSKVADVNRLITQACLMSTSTVPVVFALREESLSLLPTSTLGKILRLKLTRLFEDGKFLADIKEHEAALRRTNSAAKQICDSGEVTRSEACLVDDVAEVLGTTPELVGIHSETSIFDIGYTSMHVIKLKHYIEKRLGMDFPILHIMKNPTIRQLAACIDAQQKQRGAHSQEQNPGEGTYDPVVVFRARGSKTPLWLIHPGVGEILIFVGLAQRLAADDRPVFALRAPGFEPGQRLLGSIEEAVDMYTTAIHRRQPRGPYALAGYSYGAMLAFEVAKRFRSGGAKVCFLGSFNLPPHIRSRICQLHWAACLLHLSFFLGIITEDALTGLEADAAFCALPRKDTLQRVLSIGDMSRMEELGLTVEAMERWANLAFGLQSLAVDYEPSGEVDGMDVFHAIPLKAVAKSREEWLSQHLSRWAGFVREPPRFHAVGGTHYTMIGPENVVSFAETLVKALKARGV
ncbi:putative AMP-binding & Acyl-protein [Rosellinia necatrix]|uniref:Putative AMP-binding & Acyl-protein n=1 Tax=Rosellinia necatrix TaxID=77044 RepID=A0A1W2TSJ9_ROSNE|nr:putative AMP-binding & Acyl-protein [Rosellinia necatrix]